MLLICVVGFFNLNVGAAYRPVYDFTGDSRTDFTIVILGEDAGDSHQWRIFRNPAVGPGLDFIRVMDFGVVPDTINAADFIGDAKTDIAIWRPGEFQYYETLFPETSVAPVTYERWGQTSDNIGRDGDYDGDGKDDETIIRIVSSQLQWWIKGSGGINRVTTFGRTAMGISTFAFQGADFNNDGREELIVAEVAASGAATWFVGDSITGAQLYQVNWGNFNTDYLINPDDYTGDGIADFVVWGAGRAGSDAGNWYILNTAAGTPLPRVNFGVPGFVGGDVPLRGNYDGDQKADIAVWRPSTQTWYWLNSSDGTLGAQQWGSANTDVPLPSFFTF